MVILLLLVYNKPMKLQHRLIVSFFIIVFLPFLIAAILIAVTGRIGRGRAITGNSIQELFRYSNTIEEIRNFTEGDYLLLQEISQEDPDSFLDTDFLTIYNNELREDFSCLVVRRNGRIIFNGSAANFTHTLTSLPQMDKKLDRGVMYMEMGDINVMVRMVDLTFSDGDNGVAYLVTDGHALLPQGRQDLVDIVITVGLVLIFTATILLIWIYNGVISKVNRLIHGANNIKEGNMDFSVASDGADELSELLNTFEDMKERLRLDAEEKLNTEKAQRELISNIAHDLKTPLTAIQGYAEGLLDGVADTDEKREVYIRTIGKKAEELNSLLNELTIYSNISTNRIPYNFRRINALRYFEDVAEEASITYESSGVGREFKVELDQDTEIIIDPEQLRRVIENIISNSIKYRSVEEPFVSFRVKQLEGFVQVEIEDNGIGIGSEELPKIFDRMYRGDPSRNSAVKGSGIGLSIAKKIIEDHGGKIWATSRLNVGTCFYFLLRQYVPPVETEEKQDDKNTSNRRRRSHSKS